MLYDIEIISQVLEPSIRFLMPSNFLKSVPKRKSYEQLYVFAMFCGQRMLGGEYQAYGLAAADPGTSKVECAPQLLCNSALRHIRYVII